MESRDPIHLLFSRKRATGERPHLSGPRARPAGTAFYWSLLWQAILAAHGTAAAVWWWIMPGGFPFGHVRFWANRVLPLAVVAAAAVALVAAWMRKRAAFQAFIVAVAVAWTAALAVATVIFPVSARRFFLPALAGTAFVWLAYFLAYRMRLPRVWPMAVAPVLAAIVGGMVPWTQRAGDPDTRPLNVPLPEAKKNRDPTRDADLIRLGKNVIVFPSPAGVSVRCSGLTIHVRPVLTFTSRSPDRCWTIFPTGRSRLGPRRFLTALYAEEDSVLLRYEDDASHVLRVVPEGEDSVLIESFSELMRPVYSHVNTYCRLDVRGHEKLWLAFSPCAEEPVEVEPRDYPLGRPARLAYFDAAGSFRVAEAKSAEKGPFRTLAEGRLKRSDPLEITLHNGETPVCRVVLEDWAAQAGTALSPTAGWGLPVGAIEFARLGEAADATAAIWLTLAATAVGRGWDSVGHRAGTYRNRVRIEPAAE